MPSTGAADSRPHLRGRTGVWLRGGAATPDTVRMLEDLGYSSVWIGGSPAADLTVPESLLDATGSLCVATGVVNIWRSDVREVSASYRRVADRHADRFLLGIGAGHPEVTGPPAERPYSALSRYLDELDAGGVPVDRRVIAALGPRMLRLAGERSRGAHPFLVTAAHTAEARALLGAGPLLVPEQRVVLEERAGAARAVARASLENYLRLGNYRSSLRRLGFEEADLDGGGSDRLVDDLVPYGPVTGIAERLAAHLDAGADEVAVQLLISPGAGADDGFARLATALALS